MKKNIKNQKKIVVILILTAICVLGFAQGLLSWGDKNTTGNRESVSTALYTPARYAFDGDENTYWALERESNIGWAEQYWEDEEDVSGVKVDVELISGSELNFKYEKDGTWISYTNGKIYGPVQGIKEIEFTEEERKTKRILVTLNSKDPETDKVFEINLERKNNSKTWGK